MCELDGTKTAKAADGRNLPANIFLGHFMKPYFKDKTTGIVSKYNQVAVIDLSCICVVTVFHCNLQLSVSFLTLQSLFPLTCCLLSFGNVCPTHGWLCHLRVQHGAIPAVGQFNVVFFKCTNMC